VAGVDWKPKEIITEKLVLANPGMWLFMFQMLF